MRQSKHDADCLRRRSDPGLKYVCSCGMSDENVQAAKRLSDELNALPPAERATLLGITGPYDAALCPICFDGSSLGCDACGGSGNRATGKTA